MKLYKYEKIKKETREYLNNSLFLKRMTKVMNNGFQKGFSFNDFNIQDGEIQLSFTNLDDEFILRCPISMYHSKFNQLAEYLEENQGLLLPRKSFSRENKLKLKNLEREYSKTRNKELLKEITILNFKKEL